MDQARLIELADDVWSGGVQADFWRRRIVVDFDRFGNVDQVGYEVWDCGELQATGCRPVGPFDDFDEIATWLRENAQVQLRLW